ncbi:sigma factor [Brevibacillus thermoruber]|uniref:Sigma factor n=1 Tax=Brevibacillus thermoruber TaxID=33942 RepID=A0A9X3TPU2_9BACL|nr:sigma factor [Brevibacillus thermoruber]MDA5108204.1 sigma factor [Brevibacillus thermoruber]
MRELGEQEVRLEQTAEAAFDMLIRQYVNKVLRLVYLIVKDRNLAEDITQDVFMKAYQNIGSFRKESRGGGGPSHPIRSLHSR